jgi:hypothetical protein
MLPVAPGLTMLKPILAPNHRIALLKHLLLAQAMTSSSSVILLEVDALIMLLTVLPVEPVLLIAPLDLLALPRLAIWDALLRIILMVHAPQVLSVCKMVVELSLALPRIMLLAPVELILVMAHALKPLSLVLLV